MKSKVFLMTILALCATWCLSQVASAAPLITSVDRTNGISGDRDHIGAYTGETDPIQDQPGTLPDSWLLRDGHYCFSDRDYPWSLTPPEMIDVEYVTTFNSDKDVNTANYAVTVSGPTMFWITVDDRKGDQQAYANTVTADFASAGTFRDSGLDLFVHENDTTDRQMSVFISLEVVPAGTYNFVSPQMSGDNYYTIGAFDADPFVNAGPDQEIALPDTTATLAATIQDNGDPNGVLVYWWEVIGKPAGSSIRLDTGLGPHTINIPDDVNPNTPYAVTPTATVSQTGVYELKLNARDQLSEANDVMIIKVYPAGYEGLVGHWKLDDGIDTGPTTLTAVDSAGSYIPNLTTYQFDQVFHDGTLTDETGPGEPNWVNGVSYNNTPLLISPDDFIGAIWQDGTDDFIEVPYHSALSLTKNYTLAAWIKPNDLSRQQGIVTKVTDGSNKQYAFSVNSDGRLKLDYEVNGNNYAYNTVNDVLSVGEWQHVALTVESDLVIRMYVNGVQVGTDTAPAEVQSLTDPISIGRWAGTYNSSYFDGIIDDVRIYENTLTPAEILAISLIADDAPRVTAGADRRQVEDDGNVITISDGVLLDILQNVDITWSKLSGPGNVAFVSTNNPANLTEVQATFDIGAYGLYELEVFAQDQGNVDWWDRDTMFVMYQEKAQYSVDMNDPMALWKLNESVGATAFDSSGNDLDGTLVGDPNLPVWQPAGGKVDGALQFVNAGDDIDQAVDLSVVPATDDITIMFWMNADSESKGKLIDKLPDDTSGAGFTVYKRDGAERRIQFRIGSDDGGANRNVNIAPAYEPGVWVHVACTFDSVAKVGKVYINGLLESTETDIDQTINNVAIPLYCGMTSNTADPTARFQGILDHVRLYDIPLSEFEVAQIAIQDMVEMVGCQPARFAEQVITGDISGPEGVPDCTVDLYDYSAMALDWLGCTDLNNMSCW